MPTEKSHALAFALLSLVLGGARCSDADSQEGKDDGHPALIDPVPLRSCTTATLGRLTVVGNELRVRCGSELLRTRLKGVNRSGLQHKPGLVAAGFSADPGRELLQWREQWNATVIRVPLGQSYYLSDENYRKDVATLVASAKSIGLYVILDLHGYDAANLNPPQPDAITTPQFYAQLAERFGSEEHVLFDLLNEPHDVSWSVWKENASKLIQIIRNAGAPETLIIVGGLDWAYDLRPLLRPENRILGLGPIVYATHPYPFKSMPVSLMKEWDERFGNASYVVPIILTEYGADESTMEGVGLGSAAAVHAWMRMLHDYIDEHKLSALAWSGGDAPQLTYGSDGSGVRLPANPPDPMQPSLPFGSDVQEWMRRPIF